MAKTLRTAALIVGAVATVAVGVATANPGLVVAGVKIGTIAAAASLTATALTLASSTVANKPPGSLAGSQTAFTIDKNAGLPVMFGRSASGGFVVHRQYYGTKNSLESWVTVHSIGPIDGYESMLIDNNAVSFSSGNAAGFYHDYMWLDEQIGDVPEADALAGPFGDFPGWSGASKLSGLAADLWTLKWDTNGKKYPAGVPKRRRVLRGVKSYDPRLDSTYPGGSGACRSYDRSTWIYSESPALNALSWAIGHMMNGTKVAGGGLPITGILLPPFVEWANVCQANSWKVGGRVVVGEDDSWDVLKMICQAGAAEPVAVGGMLSVDFSAPRVSIGTITSADLAGEIDVPSTAPRKNRINGVIPRIRSEAHDWEMVPLDPVIVTDYVTFDGGKRTREVSMPLVQQVDQGAELGAYAILDSRELDPIVLPTKVYTIGYLPGDCLTVDIPEANLLTRPVVLRNRELDMGSAVVTFSCRSETPGKHDFALGRTGVAPPTPDLEVPDLTNIPAPDAGAWTVAGATLTDNGVSIPAIVITGAADNPYASQVVFEYRPDGSGTWISAGITGADVVKREITSVTPGTTYEVAISYIIRGIVGARRTYTATAGNFDAGATIEVVVPQGVSVPIGTSATISKVLAAGQTATAQAELQVGPISGGPVNVQVSIEYRLAGGSWVALASDGPAASSEVGDFVGVAAEGSVTNSTPTQALYEFRATGTQGGSGSGSIAPGSSYLRVT